MSASSVLSFGGRGRSGWPSGGSGLSPAILAALNSPETLPILQAMAEGQLAVLDKTASSGAIPLYDRIFNDTDGATKIEYPDSSVNIFDLT